MKNVLFLFLIFGATWCAVVSGSPKPEAIKPVPFESIKILPDGLNNYSSRQPSAGELIAVIESYDIQAVIRLNGAGKDAGALSPLREKAICDSLGVAFHYIKIGNEPQAYAAEIRELLRQGNTLIHCRHGYDRTGAMVGYHLRQIGMSRNMVKREIGFEDYIEKKGEAYRAYYETALY